MRLKDARKLRRDAIALVTLLYCAIFPLVSVSAELPKRPVSKSFAPTGTYTNLALQKQTGDLLGAEIRFVLSGTGYKALVQFAQGGAGEVTLHTAMLTPSEVTLNTTGRQDGMVRIYGRFTPAGLDATFHFDQGGKEQMLLKKGRSYWDR
jgi:hypothetical protein